MIELNGGPAAAGAARHAIDQLANQQQLPRIDDLRLLVSELVTNSVVHGNLGPNDRVELHVHWPDSRVRVEVCDDGAGWGPQVRSPSLDSDQETGGWGLLLVGAIADSWGIETGERTCVWFEIGAN